MPLITGKVSYPNLAKRYGEARVTGTNAFCAAAAAWLCDITAAWPAVLRQRRVLEECCAILRDDASRGERSESQGM